MEERGGIREGVAQGEGGGAAGTFLIARKIKFFNPGVPGLKISSNFIKFH